MTYAQRLESIADKLVTTALRNGPADDGDLSCYDGCDYSNLEDEGDAIFAWLEANDPPKYMEVTASKNWAGEPQKKLTVLSGGKRELGTFWSFDGLHGLWHFAQSHNLSPRALHDFEKCKPGIYELPA